jgi:hypothetical protein
MSSSSNLAWLTEQSKDEVYTFNNIVHRKVIFESVATFHGYIVQHTHYFFSPLNQIYLFLIDDLAALAFFDKVFVRDGLLTLKLFFLRNPTPNGLQTKLIINSRFRKFIPEAWCNNAFFYNYKFNQPYTNNRRTLIISYHLDSLHCPNEVLEEKLQSTDIKQYEEILCLITGMPQNGATDFIDKNIFNKAAITIQNIKANFQAVTLNELTPQKIAASDYLEINPYHFLYSDCYLRWYLIYNGATPIDPDWLSRDVQSKSIHSLLVSPFHSVDIHPPEAAVSSHLTSINEHEFFKDDLSASRNHLVNLCSNGYKRFVQSLLTEHANSNH